MAKNWDHAAGIVWGMLATSAQSRRLVTYSEVASTISTNPLSVRLALEPIQSYCLANRLPPLTSIVVGKNNSLPGEGFIAWDVDDLHSAHENVFSYSWTATPNPYGEFGESDSISSLADEILRSPGRLEEVYAKVKVRGIAQVVFRNALLRAYDETCAFCGTTFRDTLDAAHIKRWGGCSAHERLSVSNGLLLCATHHRMFDARIMTITLSNRVHFYDPEMEDGPYSSADKTLSVDLHGKNIFLPTDRRFWPGREFVLFHHQEMKWGNLP